MRPTEWRWTRLGDPHPEVLRFVHLQVGELSVVSFYRSEASWYLFTTRRILGGYSGETVEIAASKVVKDRFGDFKVYGREAEVMTLQISSGAEICLEFETSYASMVPIYYMMYWKRKYPIIDKLKDEP